MIPRQNEGLDPAGSSRWVRRTPRGAAAGAKFRIGNEKSASSCLLANKIAVGETPSAPAGAAVRDSTRTISATSNTATTAVIAANAAGHAQCRLSLLPEETPPQRLHTNCSAAKALPPGRFWFSRLLGQQEPPARVEPVGTRTKRGQLGLERFQLFVPLFFPEHGASNLSRKAASPRW